VPGVGDVGPLDLGTGQVYPGLAGAALDHGPPAVRLPTVAGDLLVLLVKLICYCVNILHVVLVVEGLLVGLVVQGGEAAVAGATQGGAGVSQSDQFSVIILIVKDRLAEGEEVFRGSPSLL